MFLGFCPRFFFGVIDSKKNRWFDLRDWASESTYLTFRPDISFCKVETCSPISFCKVETCSLILVSGSLVELSSFKTRCSRLSIRSSVFFCLYFSSFIAPRIVSCPVWRFSTVAYTFDKRLSSCALSGPGLVWMSPESSNKTTLHHFTTISEHFRGHGRTIIHLKSLLQQYRYGRGLTCLNNKALAMLLLSVLPCPLKGLVPRQSLNSTSLVDVVAPSRVVPLLGP